MKNAVGQIAVLKKPNAKRAVDPGFFFRLRISSAPPGNLVGNRQEAPQYRRMHRRTGAGASNKNKHRLVHAGAWGLTGETGGVVVSNIREYFAAIFFELVSLSA